MFDNYYIDHNTFGVIATSFFDWFTLQNHYTSCHYTCHYTPITKYFLLTRALRWNILNNITFFCMWWCQSLFLFTFYKKQKIDKEICEYLKRLSKKRYSRLSNSLKSKHYYFLRKSVLLDQISMKIYMVKFSFNKWCYIFKLNNLPFFDLSLQAVKDNLF